jgi:hypothetical protein
MMNWNGFGGSGYGIIDVLSRNLPGRNDENEENPQSG